MEIKVYDLQKKDVVSEKVYGEKFIDFLYKSRLGRVLSPVLTHPLASKMYGRRMSSEKSKAKIEDFISNFDIKADQFIKTTTDFPGWENFNQFFKRKYKKNHINFELEATLPAFCEGRYLGWESERHLNKIDIKGYKLCVKDILGHRHFETFSDGPVMVCRLAPVDYHRFHFPDDCEVIDHYQIRGSLHSVNPLALSFKKDILMVNERQVTILDTTNFGRLAMIEVGAVCVGKIRQSYVGKDQKRGSEKGYFEFGGSTVVLLGEKSKWSPSNIILTNTATGLESLARLGEAIGKSETQT